MKIDNRTKLTRQIKQLTIGMVCLILGGWLNHEATKPTWADSQLRLGTNLLSPISQNTLVYAAEADKKYAVWTQVIEVKQETIDTWVDTYAHKYFPEHKVSGMKRIAHCLLNKETAHGNNKGFGDNGKAGGILQFHEPTYIANRNRMINKGLVDHLGSRMDPEDAIETFMYMASIGQLKQWGPFLRGECQ